MAFCLSIFPRLCPTSAHALHHPPSAAVTFRLPVRYNILLFTQELPTRHEPIAQKLFRHPRRSQSGQRILRNLPPRRARSLRRRQALAASLLAESSPRKSYCVTKTAASFMPTIFAPLPPGTPRAPKAPAKKKFPSCPLAFCFRISRASRPLSISPPCATRCANSAAIQRKSIRCFPPNS